MEPEPKQIGYEIEYGSEPSFPTLGTIWMEYPFTDRPEQVWIWIEFSDGHPGWVGIKTNKEREGQMSLGGAGLQKDVTTYNWRKMVTKELIEQSDYNALDIVHRDLRNELEHYCKEKNIFPVTPIRIDLDDQSLLGAVTLTYSVKGRVIPPILG
jgi:hypothetical protein